MSLKVPIDSLVLLSGVMAQKKRGRRMSEPVPSSSVSDRAAGRRRNTLDTTPLLSGLLSPPMSPVPSSPASSQMLTAMKQKDSRRVPPPLVGKMATILPPQAQQKTKKAACDQHEMSFGTFASPMSPPADQLHKYSIETASSALAAIPESTLSSSDAALPAGERDQYDHSVRLIVLGNKKIHLARPRMVHIGAAGKQ
ncbi:hypothetical protein GGF40_000865 [Coemansia sp. RSA 1286]|nr:hypothetical protein GGF39_000836 [Coemansia sp. RSA 1721]KAJ2639405.1 hypothetical protein GGF40_000865 [Coemansia sp. RSA 1286]